jgi:hypothetical protein
MRNQVLVCLLLAAAPAAWSQAAETAQIVLQNVCLQLAPREAFEKFY